MDSVSRLRRADQIIGVSAILFFIFLFFFKWYGVSSSSSVGSFSASINGWHAFSNSRWIWLITIVVALVAVAISAGMIKAESPVSLGAVVAGLGALSTLLIFYRIIHHPTAGTSGTIAGVHFSASAGIKIGIWLGFLAAIGVTYGGYLAMQADGTSLSGVREQASGAVSGPSGSDGAASAAPADAAPVSGAPPATAPPAESAPPIPPPAAPPGPQSPAGTPPAQ
jgi:hypothetical protein